MFQKDLGSLLDKSSRVEALVPALGDAAGLGDAVPVAAQAGHLCKADLATSMVRVLRVWHHARTAALPGEWVKGGPGGLAGRRGRLEQQQRRQVASRWPGSRRLTDARPPSPSPLSR